jgi:hypothetical protein
MRSQVWSVVCLLSVLGLGCQKKSNDKQRAVTTPAAQTDESPNSGDQTDKTRQESGEESQVSGKRFFEDEVVDAFNICQRCHAPADVPVERDRGPMTIFEYEPMLAMLDANTLLPMIRSQLPNRDHPLNDPCLAGLNSSPCLEVAEWWVIEFGDDEAKQQDRPLLNSGEIVTVSADGMVTGWALDPRDLTRQVQVELAIDDPDFANPITVEANLDLPDNQSEGSHGFQLQLPPAFLDGQPHQLAARILLGDKTEGLTQGAGRFLALPKPEAGSQQRDFFTNTVNPVFMTDCGCHGNSFTYDFLWPRMLDPFPVDGGSATNNRVYEKASGGLGHSGGNLCNNSQACNVIEQWWQLEFGQ